MTHDEGQQIMGPIRKPLPERDFVRHDDPGSEDIVAEMRWATLDPDQYLTPNERFFVRSYSPTPSVEADSWHLRIEGPGVRRPIRIGYRELLSMPSVSLVRALECAGNGRVFFGDSFGRVPPGTPWGMGAIGVAEWTGVPLRELLERAGLETPACQAVPQGLDRARVSRPIPLEKALEDALVAVAMNGEPLPPDHGYPARLIVPGWAAVASIKWLGRIFVADRDVVTRWNSELYVLRGPDYPHHEPPGGVVVTEQVVKSAIELAPDTVLAPGPHKLTGRAWSPDASIRIVEVRLDHGEWKPAKLRLPNVAGAWVRWEFDWDAAPGNHGVGVRATDARGRTQPGTPTWNDDGYLNDGIVTTAVSVVEGPRAGGPDPVARE